MTDSFYYGFLLYALLLMLTGRIWMLVILCGATPEGAYRGDKQWKRYAFTGVGLAISLFVVFTNFSQYSVHQTKEWLNQMYAVSHGMGIAMWATLIIHLVTVPGMLFYWMWFYFHPVQSRPRV